jgi:hypothetical protein
MEECCLLCFHEISLYEKLTSHLSSSILMEKQILLSDMTISEALPLHGVCRCSFFGNNERSPESTFNYTHDNDLDPLIFRQFLRVGSILNSQLSMYWSLRCRICIIFPEIFFLYGKAYNKYDGSFSEQMGLFKEPYKEQCKFLVDVNRIHTIM